MIRINRRYGKTFLRSSYRFKQPLLLAGICYDLLCLLNKTLHLFSCTDGDPEIIVDPFLAEMTHEDMFFSERIKDLNSRYALMSGKDKVRPGIPERKSKTFQLLLRPLSRLDYLCNSVLK